MTEEASERCNIAGFEDRGGGHKPRAAGSGSCKRKGNGITSRISRKECSPSYTLIFSPVRPVSDF